MKIQNLHTHGMRNDSHFQFHTEFKDLVAKNGEADEIDETEEVENEI